jgi:hypothetical protein
VFPQMMAAMKKARMVDFEIDEYMYLITQKIKANDTKGAAAIFRKATNRYLLIVLIEFSFCCRCFYFCCCCCCCCFIWLCILRSLHRDLDKNFLSGKAKSSAVNLKIDQVKIGTLPLIVSVSALLAREKKNLLFFSNEIGDILVVNKKYKYAQKKSSEYLSKPCVVKAVNVQINLVFLNFYSPQTGKNHRDFFFSFFFSLNFLVYHSLLKSFYHSFLVVGDLILTILSLLICRYC